MSIPYRVTSKPDLREQSELPPHRVSMRWIAIYSQQGLTFLEIKVIKSLASKPRLTRMKFIILFARSDINKPKAPISLQKFEFPSRFASVTHRGNRSCDCVFYLHGIDTKSWLKDKTFCRRSCGALFFSSLKIHHSSQVYKNVILLCTISVQVVYYLPKKTPIRILN